MLSHRPPWTNQSLTVYHGTLNIYIASVLDGIDLSIPDDDSDFGRGFYTTTSLKQARIFAENSQMRNRLRTVRPAVLRFKLDRDVLAGLDSLWFVLSSPDSDDYWNLVESCRRFGATNRAGERWYDVAVGPVARWYRTRRAWDDYDQISFHTDKAVKILDNSNKGVV